MSDVQLQKNELNENINHDKDNEYLRLSTAFKGMNKKKLYRKIAFSLIFIVLGMILIALYFHAREMIREIRLKKNIENEGEEDHDAEKNKSEGGSSVLAYISNAIKWVLGIENRESSSLNMKPSTEREKRTEEMAKMTQSEKQQILDQIDYTRNEFIERMMTNNVVIFGIDNCHGTRIVREKFGKVGSESRNTFEKYIYKDCMNNTKMCDDNKIRAVPAWKFGDRIVEGIPKEEELERFLIDLEKNFKIEMMEEGEEGEELENIETTEEPVEEEPKDESVKESELLPPLPDDVESDWIEDKVDDGPKEDVDHDIQEENTAETGETLDVVDEQPDTESKLDVKEEPKKDDEIEISEPNVETIDGTKENPIVIDDNDNKEYKNNGDVEEKVEIEPGMNDDLKEYDSSELPPLQLIRQTGDIIENEQNEIEDKIESPTIDSLPALSVDSETEDSLSTRKRIKKTETLPKKRGRKPRKKD